MAQKSRLPLLVILLIFVFGLASAYYLGTKKQNKTKPQDKIAVSTPMPTVFITSEPAATVKPTVAETTDQKTYTNTDYGFSFMYPDGYKVEERTPGFVVVLLLNEHVPQAGISFDARLNDPFNSAASAEASISSSLDILKNRKVGDWQVYEGVGKEDMAKGISFKQAIIPYKTGVIRAETIAVSPYAEIFDQILLSFKLTK